MQRHLIHVNRLVIVHHYDFAGDYGVRAVDKRHSG